MDLVYLAILTYCKVKYDPEQSYVFIENMGDESIGIKGVFIYPGQVFALPEHLVQGYESFYFYDKKVAVVAYIVKGEETPWS